MFFPTSSGATFDGSTTYMDKSGSVLSNYEIGILSFWYNVSAPQGATKYIFTQFAGNTSRDQVVVYFDAANRLNFQVEHYLSNRSSTYQTSAFLTSTMNGLWHHAVISWDNINGGTGCYVDGINRPSNIIFPLLPALATGTTFNYRFGDGQGVEAGNVFNGSLAEVFLHTGTYYNLNTTPSLVRRFCSPSRRPIFLGTDGSKPLGVQPEIYFKGTGTGFNVNSGSAGNFTTTGTLTTPSTTPST